MVTRQEYTKWVNDDGYTMLEIRSPNESWVTVSSANAKKLRDLAEACTEAADYLEAAAEMAVEL